MSARPSSLETISRDADHAIASADGVLVSVWRGAMSAPAMQKLLRAQRSVSASHPGHVVYVNVVERGVPTPDSDVRDVYVSMVREGAGKIRCVAIVAEGEGFHGSLVRSVVAGILLVVRPAFPMNAFASVESARLWAEGHGARKLDAAGRTIADVVEATRALILPRE